MVFDTGREILRGVAELVEGRELDVNRLANVGRRQVERHRRAAGAQHIDQRKLVTRIMRAGGGAILPALQIGQVRGIGSGGGNIAECQQFAARLDLFNPGDQCRLGHNDSQRPQILRVGHGHGLRRGAALRAVHRQRIGGVGIGPSKGRKPCCQHALHRRRGNGADIGIGGGVEAQPDIAAAPVRPARRGDDDLGRAAGE